MSVRTLPVTAACSYEQNSAYVTSYQALFERLKLLPAGNLRGKKAGFSLGLARLLDTRGSTLLIIAFYVPLNLTVILQFCPLLHCMLTAPQKHGILMVKLVVFFQ